MLQSPDEFAQKLKDTFDEATQGLTRQQKIAVFIRLARLVGCPVKLYKYVGEKNPCKVARVRQ